MVVNGGRKHASNNINKAGFRHLEGFNCGTVGRVKKVSRDDVALQSKFGY